MAKIAISLPDEVLRDIEKERLARGETRSEFVRHAVDAFLRRQREREMDEQYVRAYREMPETADEVADIEGMHAAGLASFAADPWEDGDAGDER